MIYLNFVPVGLRASGLSVINLWTVSGVASLLLNPSVATFAPHGEFLLIYSPLSQS